MDDAIPDFSKPVAAMDDADIPDFSKPRTRVAFRIDDDVFESPPVLPAMVLLAYAKKFQSLGEDATPEQHMDAMTGVLEMVLLPESYGRFSARLSSMEDPIGLDQMQQAIEYIMEKYGMRPTQLPSGLPGGQASPESGTSSQGLLPGEDLISLDSPSASS